MILSAAAGVVDDAQRNKLWAAAPLRAGATRGLAANAVLDDSAKRRICYESYQKLSETNYHDDWCAGVATRLPKAKAGNLGASVQETY